MPRAEPIVPHTRFRSSFLGIPAPVLMIKKQFNRLHDKMKAITNRGEDDKKKAPLPPPAYPPVPTYLPASAYPAPLAYAAPQANGQLRVPLPPPPAQFILGSNAPEPVMAPQRVVAPFAARATHPDHPAFRRSHQQANHPIVTSMMPAPLRLHPFKPQARGHHPQNRKPLKEVDPNTVHNVPRRGVPKMASYQIPLDPSVSLDSVAHYLPVPPQYDDMGAHVGHIPTPEIFKKASKKTSFFKREMENMDEIFPDLPKKAAEKFVAKVKTESEKKREADDWASVVSDGDTEAIQSAEPEQPGLAPVSNIGTLQKLPGELRNKIYRLIAVEPSGEVNIILKPNECASGKCTHREAGNIVPGLASTCRQLRHEILPIFCAENKTFHFDHRTVAERCTVGYLETLDPYIDLIQEYKFDMMRPCWGGQEFLGDATYTLTLTTPAASATKQWELRQEISMREELRVKVAAVQPPVRVDIICQCELVKMDLGLVGLNSKFGHGSTKGCGKMGLKMASAARFSDYVYQMKKSKQYMWALPSCKDCQKVKFGGSLD